MNPAMKLCQRTHHRLFSLLVIAILEANKRDYLPTFERCRTITSPARELHLRLLSRQSNPCVEHFRCILNSVSWFAEARQKTRRLVRLPCCLPPAAVSSCNWEKMLCSWRQPAFSTKMCLCRHAFYIVFCALVGLWHISLGSDSIPDIKTATCETVSCHHF